MVNDEFYFFSLRTNEDNMTEFVRKCSLTFGGRLVVFFRVIWWLYYLSLSTFFCFLKLTRILLVRRSRMSQQRLFLREPSEGMLLFIWCGSWMIFSHSFSYLTRYRHHTWLLRLHHLYQKVGIYERKISKKQEQKKKENDQEKE